MVRDITIGQYYKVDSAIHRLDPRTKLVITILYAISLFMCVDLIMLAVTTVFLLLYIALSRVPIGYIVKGLKPVWVFVVFTAVFSIFNGDGAALAVVFGKSITWDGIQKTLIVVCRLVYLIMGAAVMTYTTRPMNLAKGMEKGLGFLKKVGVPVSEMSMMMMIALRFIPIFTEELDKIMKAQLSRGADFESNSIIKRIKSYVPVFVPLFVSAIRRATDLAEAMDARCYNIGEERTSMNPLVYGSEDYFAYGLVIMYTVGMLALRYVRNGA
jgi:energy-coupling factor transport system permease protein